MVDSSMFDQEDFTSALSMLPLVSIDLIITNRIGEVLLGKRENRPAKESWFVPGGRIRRMEKFEDAFKRISVNELGIPYNLEDASFFGIFEHMYGDSAFSDKIGSHYVSIAFKINEENLEIRNLPRRQHQDYEWFGMERLHKDKYVHKMTKEFFSSDFDLSAKKMFD